MRILSLLGALLVVAWLVYTRMGSDETGGKVAAYRQSEQQAEAVSAQVQAQFEQQAEQLAQLESGRSPGTRLEPAPADSAP